MNTQIVKYKNIALLSFLATIIPFGFVLAVAAGIMLALEEFKNKNTGLGVCLIIFNIFTSGIWSLALASMRLNAIITEDEQIIQDKSNASFGQIGFILSIVAIATTIIGIGFFVAAVAGAFVGFALIRKNQIAHGVCIIMFNALTFGIWSLVIANKLKKGQIETI